jgi:hypothetical protein
MHGSDPPVIQAMRSCYLHQSQYSRAADTGVHTPAVISSPDLGVFAVAAAGVLCAFPGVVGALPKHCLRRKPGTHISLSMPLLELSGYGSSVVRLQCLRRRRPGQVRCRQG